MASRPAARSAPGQDDPRACHGHVPEVARRRCGSRGHRCGGCRGRCCSPGWTQRPGTRVPGFDCWSDYPTHSRHTRPGHSAGLRDDRCFSRGWDVRGASSATSGIARAGTARSRVPAGVAAANVRLGRKFDHGLRPRDGYVVRPWARRAGRVQPVRRMDGVGERGPVHGDASCSEPAHGRAEGSWCRRLCQHVHRRRAVPGGFPRCNRSARECPHR